MKKSQLNRLCKDAYSEGENDTMTEDYLMESATLYISELAEVDMLDDDTNKILEAYRTGFMASFAPVEAIQRIVEYMYEDERSHWEESNKPKGGHIFNDIKSVSKWCNSITKLEK